MTIKKIKQACKPGSVSANWQILIISLVPISQPGSISLPVALVYRRAAGTLYASVRNLFDLSTRKVYHAFNVAIKAVGSYPAFSPFPSYISEGSLFSVALSVDAVAPPSC